MSLFVAGGLSGVDMDVDASRNLYVTEGIPAVPAAGGFYSVAGQTPGVVAAGLAVDVMLMSARMMVGSARKAYITRVKFCGSIATNGAVGGIAGVVGLRRFSAQTPTGGVARTASQFDENAGTVTDITDIRDSNAALTGTAPTWGTIVTTFVIPVCQTLTSGMVNGGFLYDIEFPRPLVLAAGDGIALRTVQAMAATQTWMYAYTLNWFEK